MSEEKIFDNTKIAFKLKSDSELERAYFIFKMISSQPLVKIGTAATNFALKANLPVEGLIRSTVFDHFCGGTDEIDCLPVIDKLYKGGVSSVLDYSIEGKESERQFDETMLRIIKILEFSKSKPSLPIAVFKPTGFGRFSLYEKKSNKTPLTELEKLEWSRIEARFDKVCQCAFEENVKVLIDAEESWMQYAADELVEKMIMRYNKNNVIVFNTLQTYRWDRIDYLKSIHKRAQKLKFKIGFKIVRGAYMEKERKRAFEHGYKPPICINKSATDKSFNESMIYILKNIEDFGLFIGTHNEESTYLALKEMKSLGINKNDNSIWFGQLYGMSDHISFNLAQAGYNVAKYLPFGPVKDVMPYLIRRAEENTSVAGQTTRELKLLEQERKNRRLD